MKVYEIWILEKEKSVPSVLEKSHFIDIGYNWNCDSIKSYLESTGLRVVVEEIGNCETQLRNVVSRGLSKINLDKVEDIG